MQIQDLILRLQRFWADQGCLVGQPYDLEKGAGTMNPLTFFGALGPKPWNVAYVEPSRRPADGRYGENPFRVYKHLQFQVILKPSPAKVQELYIQSLEALGIDLSVHDLRFEEDNWESPTLGAWGVGWQVVLDGMEISQFTYFQQVGGLDCRPVSAELTYGIERICMFLGGHDNIFDLPYGTVRTDEGEHTVTYGQMRQREEFELSAYSFEHADLDLHRTLFEAYEAEGKKLLALGHFRSAYEQALKMSHTFNVLDARGAVSTTERPGIIKRVRDLACACARAYVEREHQSGDSGDASDSKTTQGGGAK
ncbi:MAG TPA: glycine--tRNA ligase subunit alpha [Holophagaceae bacterium]|nr:glycine--tRNA ligase subunit alpha [Holophagaceae bacterium]